MVLRARSGWGYHSRLSLLADPTGGRELHRGGSWLWDLGQGFAFSSVAAAVSTPNPGWGGSRAQLHSFPRESGHLWNSWISQEKRRLCWKGLGMFAPRFSEDESRHRWAREVLSLGQAPKAASAPEPTASRLWKEHQTCSMCRTCTRSLGNLPLTGFSHRTEAEDKVRTRFKQRQKKENSQSCWHCQTAAGRVKGRDWPNPFFQKSLLCSQHSCSCGFPVPLTGISSRSCHKPLSG